MVLAIGMVAIFFLYQNCSKVGVKQSLPKVLCIQGEQSYPSHIALGINPNDPNTLKAFVVEAFHSSNELQESNRLYDWRIEFLDTVVDTEQVSFILVNPFLSTDTSCEPKTIRAST